jgi:serine/threonine-protein kinase
MSGELSDFSAGMLAGISAGTRIAGYRLEEQIGAGGMAVVFRAADERLGRLVALKVLAPALAADTSFRQRFIRESQAAAAVNDPHIVPVYEAGEAAGLLFIAMRYVPGRDVRGLLSDGGPLPPGRAMAIISPVASALDAAHAAGLVHRDVKPANMLLDVGPGRPDHVYLSDFGLSKAALSSTGLTRTGHLLGTPNYMAPEQIDGRPVDGRADQYALACSAFEMLAGQPPFPRDDANAVIWAHLSAPPPRLTSKQQNLPAAVDEVFARALAKSPEDRYARCAEFAEALRAALGMGPYDPGAATIQTTRRAPGDDLMTAGPAVPASTASGPGRTADLAAGDLEVTVTASQRPVPLSPGGVTPPRPAEPAPALWAAPPPLLPAGIGQYGPPRRSRSPWLWLAAITAAAVIATASGIGIALVSRHHSSGQAPPNSARSSLAATSPTATAAADAKKVATDYVDAINKRDWPLVWHLGGGNVVLTYQADPGPETYSQMVAGFQNTRSVAITSLAAAGDTATMYTSAVTTAGVTQHYQLVLVVRNGRIVSGSQYFLGS